MCISAGWEKKWILIFWIWDLVDSKHVIFSNLPTLNPMTNPWKCLWKKTENWLIWKKIHFLNPPNPKFKKSKFPFSLTHIQVSQINQFSVFFHKSFQRLVIGLFRVGRFEKSDIFWIHQIPNSKISSAFTSVKYLWATMDGTQFWLLP